MPDRLVTIKLPETVRLGRHVLVIVLEDNAADKNADTQAKGLMQFAGTITACNGVDGVEYQKKVRSEWSDAAL